MDSPNQQAADRIKQSNSILVTVSNNPSVDQLAACIALTLIFNKMGKHATAVFSGEVPSTIEFLKPEETIEKTTDSLRDFIIALDKSKADKLRYKVEDRVVRIFITPYRTSITQDDLEFSQGDPSVDTVLALGVHNQADIDQAITVHGRILHDATVITINTMAGGELGGINWVDGGASSLSEMAALLINLLDQKLIDSQIATALLTGIVSATGRFSNPQTYPQTMSISAELLAAGADQQLVAAKLDAAAPQALPIELPPVVPAAPVETLDVPHGDQSDLELAKPLHHDDQTATKPADLPTDDDADAGTQQIHIDEQGALISLNAKPETAVAVTPPVADVAGTSRESEAPKLMTEPPAMGSPASDAASATPPLGSYLSGAAPTNPDLGEEAPSGGAPLSNGFIVGGGSQPQPAATNPQPIAGTGQTLSDIEKSVHSTHLSGAAEGVPDVAAPAAPAQPAPFFPPEPEAPEPPSDISLARDAVNQAVGESTAPVVGQFDAQSLQLTHDGAAAQPVQTVSPTSPSPSWTLPTDGPSPVGNMEPIVVQPYPQAAVQPPVPAATAPVVAPQAFDPNAPPPVPPPMMPPTGQY